MPGGRGGRANLIQVVSMADSEPATLVTQHPGPGLLPVVDMPQHARVTQQRSTVTVCTIIVRSGQDYYLLGRNQDWTMRAKRKQTFESEQNEGAI